MLLFLAGLLTIAFVVLKLCGVITFGWFFVALPVIAILALGLVCHIVMGILSAIYGDGKFHGNV